MVSKHGPRVTEIVGEGLGLGPWESDCQDYFMMPPPSPSQKLSPATKHQMQFPAVFSRKVILPLWRKGPWGEVKEGLKSYSTLSGQCLRQCLTEQVLQSFCEFPNAFVLCTCAFTLTSISDSFASENPHCQRLCHKFT